jgi:maleate isomerase
MTGILDADHPRQERPERAPWSRQAHQSNVMNVKLEPIRSPSRQVRYDRGRHYRAKIGFVVLAMEQTVEDDVFRLAPEGVGVHFSRIEMSNSATVETLKRMAPGIEAAARLILPETPLDVVCYTCNCGTMVIGEEDVIAALKRARPQAVPTTVMTGVVRALKAVGARRIVVATPYLDEVNAYVLAFLKGHGFDVLDLQGLNIKNNTDIDLVEPAYIREFAASLNRPDADAVFVCCGALRALDVVEAIEREIGKPAIVSNQAMMWDCLRSAGIEDRIEGYGRLFQFERASSWTCCLSDGGRGSD